MALKSMIHKVQFQIADMDRHYYADHSLTVARHPSETDARMMVRLLAFALNADESLAFGRGVSTENEPDLWRKDLTGNIELWIQLGQPDEKTIRRACARADQVILYTYSGQGAEIWWDSLAGKLATLDNLTVVDISPLSVEALTELAAKSMTLNCMIEDGGVWMTDPHRGAVEVALEVLQEARAA
ncbi:YaeQ family protein [Halomonas lysinitropha]|uniref:YaeQ protein n=1 Tax=Halomonas lysinitropha TaxID=2607506 RepID=A0A5K1I9Q3_9GAMM|nr:YaeQ family protein [Halomonas lysinitropha]VVZ96740.1 YaeQ protein [Halomonas lysinitropha]